MDLRQGDRAESAGVDGQPPGEALEERAPADHEAVLAALEDLERCPFSECPRCRSTTLQRWGKGRAKVQRWRCRACGRSFSATADTLLARLHAPGKLRFVLLDMLTRKPSSCRCLAATLGVSRTTIWAWRMRVNRAFELLAAAGDAAVPDRAADETVVLRESRKASREWVDHQRDPENHPAPDRLRWVDYRERHLPLPQPMTPHLLRVRLMLAENGACTAVLLPQPADTTSCAAPVDAAAVQPAAPLASARSGNIAPAGHQMNADAITAMRDTFTTFLRPFCGPARQHLLGYVAWFVAWSASSTERCEPTVAARAWQELTAARPTRFWTWTTASP